MPGKLQNAYIKKQLSNQNVLETKKQTVQTPRPAPLRYVLNRRLTGLEKMNEKLKCEIVRQEQRILEAVKGQQKVNPRQAWNLLIS